MVNFNESALVFAYGPGKSLKSKQGSQVFFTNAIPLLGECRTIMQHLHSNGKGESVETQAGDWLTDAVLEASYTLEDREISVYGAIDYVTPGW